MEEYIKIYNTYLWDVNNWQNKINCIVWKLVPKCEFVNDNRFCSSLRFSSLSWSSGTSNSPRCDAKLQKSKNWKVQAIHHDNNNSIILIIVRQEKMYIIDIIPYPNSVSVSFLYVVDPFTLLTTSTSIFNDFGRSKWIFFLVW